MLPLAPLDALTTGFPLVLGVDPVLLGIITVLLLLVFALFLFLRKTLLSFSEGIRKGKQ